MQENVMHDQYVNACNEYFKTLNKVNCLLLKQHTYSLQKINYQQQLNAVNKHIKEIQNQQQKMNEQDNNFEQQQNNQDRVKLSVQAEYQCLHNIISINLKEIATLKHKLQPKETMISQLHELQELQKKYLPLVSREYHSNIQQKLSMIRGKVDELKKKVKEINKDILSYQQQHTIQMDQYSFSLKSLEIYQQKNAVLRQEIQRRRKLHN